MRVSRLADAGARVRFKGESLDQIQIVKQRPGRHRIQSGRRRGPSAKAHEADRGHYLAAETLFGWFSPSPREISGGLAPFVCPVRLAPSGQRALKAVIYRVASGSRDGSSL
jgi:hypothetical protein